VNNKTLFKFLVCFGVTLFLALLVFWSIESKPYQILELKALDLRFVFKGARAGTSSVVHIDMDDQSLAALGRWPWPRTYHAQMTSILKECQARQILMDIIFSEEHKEFPEQDIAFAEAMAKGGLTYLPFYFVEPSLPPPPGLKELLLKDISATPEMVAEKLGIDIVSAREKLTQSRKMLLDETVHDVLRLEPEISIDHLFEKVEETRGWFLFPEDELYIQDHFKVQKAARLYFSRFARDAGQAIWPFAEEPADQSVPILEYVRAIRGGGYINAGPDIDGVNRRVSLFQKHEDRLYAQLSVSAIMDYLSVEKVEARRGAIVLKNAAIQGKNKDIVIPVDAQGKMLINWAGRWGESFAHLPYYAILRLAQLREHLRGELEASLSDASAIAYLRKTEAELLQQLRSVVSGKICVIGLTATGTNDLSPIPLQEKYPMVGLHANLINTILNEDFIRRVDGPLLFAVFILTALVVALSSLLSLPLGFVLTMGYAVLYFFLSLYLFVRFGWWVDLVGPFGIVVFGFSAITCFRFLTEEREKLWIKKAFSHYLSSDVITELMNDPSRLKLGGERRMLTVFFSDVRGFTAFSETRQPEEVVAMLNEILSEQVKIVFKYNGTLDKFVGDELMAFFGAPGNRHLSNHALMTVRMAIDIQTRMRELQSLWIQQNKPVLHIGIGINTGDMVVGNMGSVERMDYTVIGDNVNLGARLCSAAGKDEIIISETTYFSVADHIQVEKLEPIAVKGKVKPISIYRVTGLKQE
jgi:adenylate cyclase